MAIDGLLDHLILSGRGLELHVDMRVSHCRIAFILFVVNDTVGV